MENLWKLALCLAKGNSQEILKEKSTEYVSDYGRIKLQFNNKEYYYEIPKYLQIKQFSQWMTALINKNNNDQTWSMPLRNKNLSGRGEKTHM